MVTRKDIMDAINKYKSLPNAESRKNFDQLTKPSYEMASEADIANLTKPNYEMGTVDEMLGKTSSKQADLDNLFRNTKKIGGELLEDAGKVVSKAGKAAPILKGAGRVATKFLGPVGAVTTGIDLLNMASALNNANRVNQQVKADEAINAKFNELKAQGVDERTAWQMANGLPVNSAPSKPAATSTPQQTVKASTMKEKMMQEKAKDTQNLPSASGGIENLINKQRAKYGAYEGTEEEVPTTLPASLPVSQTTPMEQGVPSSSETAPMEQVVQQPMQNVQPQSPVQESTLGRVQQSDLDLINAIQAGYVNQQDIYDRINQTQQRLYDTINQGDYRYRGEIVQPQNPYQVDIDKLQADQNAYRNRANLDWMLGRTSAPDQRAMELENARQLYQAQLANQLGIPYEDYAGAMADRRAEQIKAQSQEAINQLQFMQNQTSDMKEKLAYASKIKEIQQKTDDAIMKTLLESKRAIDVANIQAGSAANVANINALSSQNVAQMNNTARILEEEMKLQDPVTQMKNISTTAMQLGYVPKEALMAFFNVNRNARLAMFGQDATPEQIAQTFGNIPQQQANNLFVKLQSMFGGN